ncbi:hypothetical protein V8G54_009212 [Vigna mungo]|uniref:Uncharacterized protein n=1 Tax=Vigna mungo TaxID=3915 RepID=A0AAQ3NU18_VIGMU
MKQGSLIMCKGLSLVTPSLNYTQGSYSQGANQRGGFQGSSHGGGGPAGECGGKFANFQCQTCLKFGHIANVCYFRFHVSYKLHESLFFIDPVTQMSISYSAGSYKTSNTWVNPHNKSNNNNQPSAMLMKSDTQGNANSSRIPDFGNYVQDVRLLREAN